MDIEEIKRLLECIDDESSDLYNRADEGKSGTGDEDPCASEVSSIINDAWSTFDDMSAGACNITDFVEEILGYLEGETPEVTLPVGSICKRCGSRQS